MHILVVHNRYASAQPSGGRTNSCGRWKTERDMSGSLDFRTDMAVNSVTIPNAR